MSADAVDLKQKLSLFTEQWSPKVVKLQGEEHAVRIKPTGVIKTGDAGGELTADYDDSLLSPLDRA